MKVWLRIALGICLLQLQSGECMKNESALEVMDRIVSVWNSSPEGKEGWRRRIWNSVSRSNPCHKEKGVYFYLYSNPMVPAEYTEIKSDSLQTAKWEIGAPLKVLIHGFQGSRHTLMPQMVKDAYLERQRQNNKTSYNILVVDWACYSQDAAYNVIPLYSKALNGISIAATHTTDILIKIMSLPNPPIKTWESIHIIGHSLGAHVGGVVGYQIQVRLRRQIGRITGLDPAGPGITTPSRLFNQHRCLHHTDAGMVDVISTAWGSSVGLGQTMGTAAFYPKDTLEEMKEQLIPGCTDTFEMVGLDSCSHRLTPIYFSLSILKDDLEACGCNGRTEADFTADKIVSCMSKCEHRIKFGEPWHPTSKEMAVNFVDIPHGTVRLMLKPESSQDLTRNSEWFPGNFGLSPTEVLINLGLCIINSVMLPQ